jgi:hypothetical protein
MTVGEATGVSSSAVGVGETAAESVAVVVSTMLFVAVLETVAAVVAVGEVTPLATVPGLSWRDKRPGKRV